MVLPTENEKIPDLAASSEEALLVPASQGLNFGFAGPGTSVKPDVGKGKAYQVPEFFAYNNYSYFDVEKDMLKDRVQQPKSGLSEFW